MQTDPQSASRSGRGYILPGTPSPEQVVVSHVDHKNRNLVLATQKLKPFGNLVTAVVCHQQEIRHRHVAGRAALQKIRVGQVDFSVRAEVVVAAVGSA